MLRKQGPFYFPSHCNTCKTVPLPHIVRRLNAGPEISALPNSRYIFSGRSLNALVLLCMSVSVSNWNCFAILDM